MGNYSTTTLYDREHNFNMETTYIKVDPKHPFVGLNNEVCSNPRHYCCCHDVWLSEEDAQRRKCRCRSDSDGRCHAFKENHYNQNIEIILKKTRKCSSNKHPNSSYRKSSRKRW